MCACMCACVCACVCKTQVIGEGREVLLSASKMCVRRDRTGQCTALASSGADDGKGASWAVALCLIRHTPVLNEVGSACPASFEVQ